MNGLNALVLSDSSNRLEYALLQHPAFALVSTLPASQLPSAAVLLHETDLLFCDSTMAESDLSDILTLVVHFHLPCPPRIVLYGNRTENCAVQSDSTLLHPFTHDHIEECLLFLSRSPYGFLVNDSFSQRISAAHGLLLKTGMNPSLKGFSYIEYGIAILSCYRRNDIPLMQWLYPQIAHKYGTSTSSVERCIRTAVECAWLQGNLTNIHRMFGYSVDANRGKATNAEFLFRLSYLVQRIVST